MRDIENRDDLSLLVHTFYKKIRENQEIGHFFNETITDWDSHLEKLTDFWENNLFAVRKYHGDPLKAHVEVDEKFKKYHINIVDVACIYSCIFARKNNFRNR